MIYKTNSTYDTIILKELDNVYNTLSIDILNESLKDNIKEFFKRIIDRLKSLWDSISENIKRLFRKASDEEANLKRTISKMRSMYNKGSDDCFKYAFLDDELNFNDLSQIPKIVYKCIENNTSELEFLVPIPNNTIISQIHADSNRFDYNKELPQNESYFDSTINLIKNVFKFYGDDYSDEFLDDPVSYINIVLKRQIEDYTIAVTKEMIQKHIDSYASSIYKEPPNSGLFSKKYIELDRLNKEAEREITELNKEIEQIDGNNTDSRDLKIRKIKIELNNFTVCSRIIHRLLTSFLQMYEILLKHKKAVVRKLIESARKVCDQDPEYYAKKSINPNGFNHQNFRPNNFKPNKSNTSPYDSIKFDENGNIFNTITFI